MDLTTLIEDIGVSGLTDMAFVALVIYSLLVGLRNTRRAAALGLSERTDALCLVVSEERGSIFVARHGRLREVGESRELRLVVESFLREFAAEPESTSWRRLLRSNLREKVVSVGLALALWFVLVHESRTVYGSFRVPLELAHIPARMAVARDEPSELEVTFSAPRKSFYVVRSAKLRLVVRTWDLARGRSSIPVLHADLSYRQGLDLENVKPREVVVEVVSEPTETDS
jgi:hypothetical protein